MASIRQKKAIKRILETRGKIPLGTAMREAGYEENTAKNPKNLTDSKAFKSIADQIPDSLLVKKHNDLLKQKQLNYFVFPKSMEDEEIVDKVKSAGFDTIVIRPSDKGKMAFYSIDDAQAISKGLDLAYKLKGSFAAEKQTIRFEDVPEEEKQAISKAFNNL